MNFKLQRRLAAQLLKCGENRVRFLLDEDATDDVIEKVENAITRSDIRNLFKRYHPRSGGGLISKHQKRGVSRGRARYFTGQKRSGRRRGPGSRRGTANARYPRKLRWMNEIRAVRDTLRELRDSGQITKHAYREFYRKSKGGAIRSRARVIAMLMAAGHLKEAPKFAVKPKPAPPPASKPAPKSARKEVKEGAKKAGEKKEKKAEAAPSSPGEKKEG